MSSLFNLTPNIIPYNLSLLQDIDVDTINGNQYLPFNGVIGNTNYSLIYNSATAWYFITNRNNTKCKYN